MARVLSLVTFSIEPCHHDEFLRRASEELKPFWEARGSSRYEVYAEMGPTGPTGRLVEVNELPSRESYLEMSRFVREGANMPDVAYRHVHDAQFQILEVRV